MPDGSRGPGQPPYKPTAASRRRVSIAAAGGMTHEELALALGISRNTLEKHFAHELSVGAYERRVEIMESMFKAAKKGNVAAAKLFAQMQVALAVPPEQKEPKPDPIGKKEQANIDATTARQGTDWHDLLPQHRSH